MEQDKTDINKWEQGKLIKTKSGTRVGIQQYVNPETGEFVDFTVIDKNISKDINFHKIWLQDVLNVLDSFGNKKILVITYLLKSMRNEDNTISGSYREIAKGCDVSVPTVSVVMNELLESDVIRKVATGTYQFNPSLIIRGGSDKRKNLLIRYNFMSDEASQINNAKTIKQLNMFGGIDLIDPKSLDNER